MLRSHASTALIAVVFFTSLSLLAQRTPRPAPAPGLSQPGIGNRSEIRVEIQLVDDGSRPLPIQALVEITGMGSVNTRTYTNMDGKASFTLRSGASYQVQVSSGDIENASSSFEVQPGEMFHHEYVTVKAKPNANFGAPGGMVSAANLNIPDKAVREYDKGMKEFRDKKWDKASEHFHKALEAYPKYDSAYNNLGVAAMQQGDLNGAREAFAKAVETNPSNAAASRNLGRIYLTRDNNLPRAKEMLLKSLTAEPKSGETLTLLSFAQLRMGELDAALSNARKVHTSGPTDQYPFAHLVAARALEEKGDKPGAAAEYHAYLKEAEGSPDAKVAKDGLARLGEK
jgi:Flp pilus assembly protein TadD